MSWKAFTLLRGKYIQDTAYQIFTRISRGLWQI